MQLHHVVGLQLDILSVSQCNELHGNNTRHTQFEQVVSDTEVVGLQQFPGNIQQDGFLMCTRSHILCMALDDGFWQLLTVNLTRRCHRHALHRHIDCRHHIFCQCLCQRMLQVCSVNFLTTGEVAAQMLCSVDLPHFSTGGLDVRILTDLVLNLTELNTIATQLHLEVDTS